ncbi:defective in Cullin neddylation protein 1 [Armillaria luteobubalina]|uniref:Defective in cullin neddylation protein n=1 Tax=Armillaria luteobubalina TaxID=153913 RepID=A0AA39ULK8_9AGAR|nr:defective in Cullin neddylation protein 1 [Armillaria luteobubalina]
MQTNQITPSTPFSSIVAVVVALLFALILYYTRGMKSTKFTNSKKMSDETTAQFCSVTGAQPKDAKRYLDKYRRLDAALDAYFNDPDQPLLASTSKLNALFDKYKDPDGDEITIDGTIKFCEDLAVNPEDVVLLSIAYELKSKRMGEWGRQGWLEGWRNLGSDNIPAMRAMLPKLSQKLSSDPVYFRKVYNHTFDFGRSEGQRSLAMDSALAFWALLLPHGLKGGALSHDDEGWKDQYTQWWFEYLEAKGGKGVSKDTWSMVCLSFQAWPSTIDDFVERARERLKSSA